MGGPVNFPLMRVQCFFLSLLSVETSFPERALEVTANYTLLQRRECGGVMGQFEKQETGNGTGNKNESDTITGMEY